MSTAPGDGSGSFAEAVGSGATASADGALSTAVGAEGVPAMAGGGVCVARSRAVGGAVVEPGESKCSTAGPFSSLPVPSGES